MTGTVRVLLWLAVASTASVASAATPPSEDQERQYESLRDDENWAWLRDAHQSQDLWDPLKYARLIGGREDVFLTLGGEVREWVEGYQHEFWGVTGSATRNVYWLQRYMVHVDAHLTPYVRVFAQLKSGIEYGRIGGPRPIDQDLLDFNQLYVDAIAIPARSLDDNPELLIRVGRQEMSYGSARLVDVREGPNVRTGYDGARVIARPGPFRFDAFAVRPDLTNPGAFDDGWDPHQAFWGAWGTLRVPAVLVDTYYLGLQRDRFTYQRNTGDELRHSLGARVLGTFGVADVDIEGVYQFGQMGGLTISAWTLVTQAVLRSRAPLKPVVTLGFGVTSGDHGGGSTLGTFSPLFPGGAPFGATLNGASNNACPHVALDLSLPHAVFLSTEVWATWRESTSDGIYTVPGTFIIPGSPGQGRYIGTQVQGILAWQADRHLTFGAIVAYFARGEFFNTVPSGDVTYAALWGAYKF